MNKGICAETLMSTLPEYLRRDSSVCAIAESIAARLTEIDGGIDGVRIFARIDELPEELLDILAYDFLVEWWDPDYSLEQKRQTLKDSWAVHRTLGTKYAVETAISAVYRDTYVTEWFQYGGEPYHFTLHVDLTYEKLDPAKHRRVLDRLEYYKNLRSHPYRIEYTARPFGISSAYAACAGTALSGSMSATVETKSIWENMVYPACAIAALGGEMTAKIQV